MAKIQFNDICLIRGTDVQTLRPYAGIWGDAEFLARGEVGLIFDDECRLWEPVDHEALVAWINIKTPCFTINNLLTFDDVTTGVC